MITRLLFGLLLTVSLHAQPFSPQDPVFSQICSPLMQGCAGYWRLEEASGVRYDLSGKNITLTSNNSVGQAAGIVGNCASFVGTSSQYLSASSSNSLQFSKTQPFTLTAWVKLTNATAAELILAKFDNAAQRGYAFLSNGGKLFFELSASASSARFVTGTTVITNQAWHFVAATYDGSGTTNGMVIYVDNSVEPLPSAGRQSNGIFDDILNAGFFDIGTDTGVTGAYANGLIDEPGVWNRMLPASGAGSLSTLYHIGLGTHIPWASP